MVGAYTPFEVEAERRREVLADSMRDSRGTPAAPEDARHEPFRVGTSDGRGLAEFAAGLLNRVTQRV